MSVRAIRPWLGGNPWVWSFVGATLVWLAIIFIAGSGGGLETLSIALQFATFFVIAGLGQMLVITAGPGNIDLSIPGVMTFAGYVAIGAMDGGNAGLAEGLALGVGVGLAAGAVNVVLIRGLRIPPMVATLASGFILDSMATAYASHSHAKPADLLAAFAADRVFGLSAMTALFIVITALAAIWFRRAVAGRTLLALGQNRRAAMLAGLAVVRMGIAVYVLSGLLAAIAGILLAADSGGASLDMANDYLLMSIAVVVLGGTSIAGGSAAPAGLWGAALLLGLVVTMLNLLHVAEGVRFIVTGLIIIAVLALAKGE
ncbi:MAG: ABC transporter permease [Acidiphilium sp.]